MKKIEVGATVFTLIGYFGITQGFLVWGFGISLIANILWIHWGKACNAQGIVIVNTILGICGILGIVKLI